MKLGAGSVVVVTGAASGIGRALTVELSTRGAAVAMIDVDEDGLREVARVRSGCTPYVCDVSDATRLAYIATEIATVHHRVDAVINNAGVSVSGPVEALTPERFARAMDVNFWGIVNGCHAFLPALRSTASRGEPAALCNMLSTFAFFPLPTKAAYAASKHAAHAFTLALGAELAGSGIRVTAVYPGAVDTPLVLRGFSVDANAQAREATLLARGLDPSRVARRIVRAIERSKRRVIIGRDARMLDIASRLAPNLVQTLVQRFWRRAPFL
jgi:short-subunit dehydrogenase